MSVLDHWSCTGDQMTLHLVPYRTERPSTADLTAAMGELSELADFLPTASEARRPVASRELRSERKMKDGKKEEEKSGRETEVENQVGQGQASFNLNREIKFND